MKLLGVVALTQPRFQQMGIMMTLVPWGIGDFSEHMGALAAAIVTEIEIDRTEIQSQGAQIEQGAHGSFYRHAGQLQQPLFH